MKQCLVAVLLILGYSMADNKIPAGPVTYVAIGASDTVGYGTARPEVEGWVPQVAARLPAGSRFVNLGVSGSTIRQAMREQLPLALREQPNLVTVWLAVNDFNEQAQGVMSGGLRAGMDVLRKYQNHLDDMLRQLKATGAAVYVGNVPDLTKVEIYQRMGVPAMMLDVAVSSWNNAIQKTVRKHGAALVDLHTFWNELERHPEYVGSDGFHPSRHGYKRLSQIFWSAIEPHIEGHEQENEVATHDSGSDDSPSASYHSHT